MSKYSNRIGLDYVIHDISIITSLYNKKSFYSKFECFQIYKNYADFYHLPTTQDSKENKVLQLGCYQYSKVSSLNLLVSMSIT